MVCYLKFSSAVIWLLFFSMALLFCLWVIYAYGYIPLNMDIGNLNNAQNNIYRRFGILIITTPFLILSGVSIYQIIVNIFIRKKMYLEISKEGLHCLGCKDGVKIPWGEINFIELQEMNFYGIHKARTLVVDIKNKDIYFKPSILQKLGVTTGINLNFLNAKEDEIISEINKYHHVSSDVDCEEDQ